MIEKWSSRGDSISWKKMKEEIHRTFSSASNLNRCFLHRSQDKHFQTSPKYSGVNLTLAQLAFEKLAQRANVLAEVEAALLHLLPSLKEPVGVEGLRIFQLLHELLRVMRSTKLAEAIAAAMRNLSAESLQVIVDWWSSLPPSAMGKHVKVWTQALSTVLWSIPAPRNAGVTNMLLVLQQMHNANSRITGRQRIPEKMFCLEVSEKFLEEDLLLWRSMAEVHINDQPLILCNFPFLMDLKSKQTVFDINSAHTQTQHMGAPELVYGWVPQPGAARFVLNLRRASLMTDTFTQLAAAPHNAFKKPLRVHLDEDPKVTDVYKRDLFHHLFENMMSSSSGMFQFNESQTLAWFPSRATEEDKRNFYLFGVLCGLALYNQSIIDLPFPLALFKKLLGVEPTLEDLREFSATGETLQNILDYGDDVVEDLFIDFVINWDGTEVDLDPQDPRKPVTGQNKKEFVDAYVNYVFNTSVEGVFQEFKRGFFQVCDQDVVKLFRPEELQGALIGQDVYDWVKLKKNTLYDWVLDSHPIKQMFWEVFDELSEEQKRDFLRFVTGYRRVPILGMDQIKMKVRVKQIETGSYDEHFPESLTCHSILELPLYSTKKILRDRLTKALMPERGFQPQ